MIIVTVTDIIDSCPSPTACLILLSYSMAVFSANLFGPFIEDMNFSNHQSKTM